ncbi:MAG: M3 family metallopeptidase, partial [Kangiellaceae bacterium]|nr:M3 family metallopeptidase [Kangiellaceae bacterium]
MKFRKLLVASLVSSLIVACGEQKSNDAQSNQDADQKDVSQVQQEETKSNIKKPTNLLLAEWTGPYQGVPVFDKVSLDELKPALEVGMEINLKEVKEIADNPDPATFENTIVAMERTGQELNRIFTYWGIWSSNKSSPEFRAIQREMAPKLSAFSSKINQNEKLFARVKAVYEGEEMKSLRPDQQRLVQLTYNGFARNGATLKGEPKKRYAEINQRLAELHTKFSNNVLADEENYVLLLNKEQLGGLPDSVISAAAGAAKAREHEGKYAITNTRSSMDPFLTYSTERELRKKVWETYYNRGDNGDEFDNNKLIAEILKLRHERVNLLGYPDYASWRLEDRMAKKPENAMKLMQAVWPAAIARVKEEVADMQAIANKEGQMDPIKPWDYRYYAEKVRKAKYDLDSDEVKQYLQLDNLREAMFYVAGRLFNFKFTPVKEGSVPVFHTDVKVWEVTDLTSGEHIGLWYLDPFARQGKRSGAWATSYRSHTTYDGKRNVLASNNSNFIKGNDGEPTLISWDDAETFFHEFGHALHSLSSRVAYPSLNGGVRDYTEFQSQLLERWLATDEVINRYLVHYKTGKPMPAELIAKIKKAATFNEGFKTTEYLASALVDMKLHTTNPEGIDADKFERETL